MAPVSILMTQLPGEELFPELWEWFTAKEKQTMILAIKEILRFVHSWVRHPSAKSALICSIIGTPIRSVRVPYKLMPPCLDEAELNSRLIEPADSISEFEGRMARVEVLHSQKHEVVFTHGDLAPHNILVMSNGRIAGLIDSEAAGYYPKYWEYTTAWSVGTKGWWFDIVHELSDGKYHAEREADADRWTSLLVHRLRNGSFNDTKFSPIVGVGHSFGSALTQGLCAADPKAFDAAILTGSSTYHRGMPAFSLGQNTAIAALSQPYRFSGLSTGYTVLDTDISNQIPLFHSPGFNPKILSLAPATKATTTLGEFFTTGNTIMPTKNFTGPVAIVDGAEDLGFCFGDCSYPVDRLEQTIAALFPSLSMSKRETYEVPMTGHGVNLHYAAERAYRFIQQFLESKGL